MEFIIFETWEGWGIWQATKNWKKEEPLAIFSTRAQAEDHEARLKEPTDGVY